MVLFNFLDGMFVAVQTYGIFGMLSFMLLIFMVGLCVGCVLMLSTILNMREEA